MKIVLNGRDVIVDDGENCLTFGKLVEMEFGLPWKFATTPTILFANDAEGRSGTLHRGQSVGIKEGTSFIISETVADSIKKMVLACPDCGRLHIDDDKTKSIPHEKHVCKFCGCEWKPYEFPTIGVPPKLGLAKTCKADEIPPGGLFRKQRGELYYLRIGEYGLLYNFGPKEGFANPGLGMRLGSLIFGVAYNGNMTVVERNTIVVQGTLADMINNLNREKDFEREIGVHGEQDEDGDFHHSNEFRQD